MGVTSSAASGAWMSGPGGRAAGGQRRFERAGAEQRGGRCLASRVSISCEGIEHAISPAIARRAVTRRWRRSSAIAVARSGCGATARWQSCARLDGRAGGRRFPSAIAGSACATCRIWSCFPSRYPGVQYGAVPGGTGIAAAALRHLVRRVAGAAGPDPRSGRHAARLRRLSERFMRFGIGRRRHGGRAGRRRSCRRAAACACAGGLMRGAGDGPQVPVDTCGGAGQATWPRGGCTATGAMPCMGLLTLEELVAGARRVSPCAPVWMCWIERISPGSGQRRAGVGQATTAARRPNNR